LAANGKESIVCQRQRVGGHACRMMRVRSWTRRATVLLGTSRGQTAFIEPSTTVGQRGSHGGHRQIGSELNWSLQSPCHKEGTPKGPSKVTEGLFASAPIQPTLFPTCKAVTPPPSLPALYIPARLCALYHLSASA